MNRRFWAATFGGSNPLGASLRSSRLVGEKGGEVACGDDDVDGEVFLVTLSVLVAVLAMATTAATADTAASRPRTIASYCSSSGDVCYGIFNRSGKVLLEITTAARYFTRYTLCVTRLPPGTDPEHAQRWGAFPVFRRSGSTWGSSVNYARQYPPLPLPGRYRVTLRLVCSQCTAKAQRHGAAGSPLGPPLHFRVPRS
jgi:hypothetical protein